MISAAPPLALCTTCGADSDHPITAGWYCTRAPDEHGQYRWRCRACGPDDDYERPLDDVLRTRR